MTIAYNNQQATSPAGSSHVHAVRQSLGFARAHRNSAQALDAALSRPAVHDGDLQPAVHLDAAHALDDFSVRREALAAADHLLAADSIPDLPVSVSGLADRALRSASVAV